MIDPKRDRLVIVASSLGTVFEWYDFFLYGILASLLGKLFFATGNPTTELLFSLFAFAIGFFFRPLGALLFGWFGDKVGRKYTFLITISVMGGATACIGLLPTFEQAGIAAPIMLLVL
ncbi:MFS transporter, partial [Sandarakinorhabdus sp.]|uniref:MFS transporter n=1 Tax=Sandarakinorhabdus sp. TaxID=1916663 RepID=UPI00286D83EE